MTGGAPLGVVLAGGAARRMAGGKSVARLGERPLLQYAVDALRGVCDGVVVACKRSTPLPELEGLEGVWREEPEESHPLVGVAAALRRAERDVLVCAGDMPLVDEASLRALVAGPPEAPGVVARVGARLQPLLALYRSPALPVLEAMGTGERAADVVARLGPAVVDVPPATAFNVNTPQDLATALAIVRRSAIRPG